MNPHVSAIAAMSENRVIGRDGDLPWNLPEDMKRFKDLTKGHAVLMGRTTYDSLPSNFKPLPNRLNIVATRSGKESDFPEGVKIVRDAKAYVQSFLDGKEKTPTDTLWVIGGAQIYRETLKFFDEIYLTKIHRQIEGDATFPEFEDRYQETSAEKKDGFTFYVYHRIIPIP